MIQDIIYRHFVYDRYHWNPLIPGNVEKLHRDYAIGNFYVVQKYNLSNEVIIPADFYKESINQICSFNLEELAQNMNSYFVPIEDDDIFFFTKEMTDEYIAETVEYCLEELDNPKDSFLHNKRIEDRLKEVELEKLATELDEMAYDWDTYGYKDAVDDREVKVLKQSKSHWSR